MKFRPAPVNFECPYQRACPHMDGISARWAFSVFQEQWRLEDQVRTLESDLDQLRTEHDELRIERDQIKAQFTALHKKQFKAGKPKAPPPLPPDRATRKKRGPPVGHPPWSRPTPAHVDRNVPVPAPTVCPHCACSALFPSQETVDQIQEDIILQPRPVVTHFHHNTAFCPNCRRPVYATAPGELRNCSIGPTTKAVGVWLHHQLKLPFRQVQDLFATLFGMSFVPASALNFSLTAAGKSQPLYDDLREKIRASMLLHLDETSWRLDGSPAWLWYAGNADLDFFHIDRSRATEVIAEILGDGFCGDIVSDGYAVYDAIMARWRQTCLAHIIRTAKEIAAELQLIDNPAPYQTDIAFANAIAGFFSEVCHLDQKRRSGQLSRKRARALVPTLRRRLKALCSVEVSHPKTLNIRDRLLSPERDAKKLFTFLTRPGMPPTNNHAERALRGPVLARKISFGSRSDAGAHAFAVLASILGTARRQDQPAIPLLYTLFTAESSTAQAALYANSA
jgi:transposase